MRRQKKPRRGTSFVVQSPKGSGPFYIQPWIEHPPFCTCSWCAANRRADEWDTPVVKRINRKSKFPFDYMRSVSHAEDVKREEERALVAAVEEARRREAALGSSVCFADLCDLYTAYQKETGKRHDRDGQRIKLLKQRYGHRDGGSIGFDDAEDLSNHLTLDRGVKTATVNRYLTTFQAILNYGVKRRKIAKHGLHDLPKAPELRGGRPKTFTERQVAVLLGEAMDMFEREQSRALQAAVPAAGRKRGSRKVSQMPLRGFCLVAYRTLIRPSSNFGLKWEELHFASGAFGGHFDLGDHKNKAKGIEARGPLSASLVRYLTSIKPERRPRGLVHPNPDTGKPYVNIRKQWERLVAIANGLLPADEQITGDMGFYQWRHTGASELVAQGADPVMLVRMMGDMSLTTVMKHYFDSSLTHMRTVVDRWDRPATDEAVVAVN